MSRKDYQLIADAISASRRDCSDERQRDVVYFTARRIAFALRRDNPRFELARFMAAAGFPADV